ncbi:imidazolonepropionase [Deferribacter thermophilus]|uniref:imidazolonepropionase n=1 Tax=Deferribacter thermophilus TaxID=53573 RepID=UPI003C27D4EB
MRKVIKNIKQLVTSVNKKYAVKDDAKKLDIYENVNLIIEDGIIVDITTKEAEANEVIDATGKVVLPAFVDPHTHIPFIGSREDEFNKRIMGKTYMEIAAEGGGINSTVRAVRNATFDELYEAAKKDLELMISFGVATVEMKSGYGLDLENEIKQLKVIRKLQEEYPVDIKSTFLGAHEIPLEYRGKKEEYIDLVINKMLPAVKEKGLAEYVDIFCEKGVFELDDTRKILRTAKELGFKVKIHADEIYPLGGAELCAEFEAVSGEHLVKIKDEHIEKMIDAGCVFNLLPATTFFLMSKEYAPARKILDKGGIVALSTDLNPGSSYTHSIQMVMVIACLNMGMTMEEVINAVTINGAYSLELSDKTGSIHRGKQADLVILDAPDYRYLVYNFGVNRINKVIKKGEIIFQK